MFGHFSTKTQLISFIIIVTCGCNDRFAHLIDGGKSSTKPDRPHETGEGVPGYISCQNDQDLSRIYIVCRLEKNDKKMEIKDEAHWSITDKSNLALETRLLSDSSQWHVSFSSNSPWRNLESPVISFESDDLKLSSPLEQAILIGEKSELDLTGGYLIYFNGNKLLENWELIETTGKTEWNTQSSHEQIQLNWTFTSPSMFATSRRQEAQYGKTPWKSLLASSLVFTSSLEVFIEGLPNNTYRVLILSASSDQELASGQSFVVDIFKNDMYQRITGFTETKLFQDEDLTGIESFAKAEFEAPVGESFLRFMITSETEQPITINAIMILSY